MSQELERIEEISQKSVGMQTEITEASQIPCHETNLNLKTLEGKFDNESPIWKIFNIVVVTSSVIFAVIFREEIKHAIVKVVEKSLESIKNLFKDRHSSSQLSYIQSDLDFMNLSRRALLFIK